jgi:hypothetical protein
MRWKSEQKVYLAVSIAIGISSIVDNGEILGETWLWLAWLATLARICPMRLIAELP